MLCLSVLQIVRAQLDFSKLTDEQLYERGSKSYNEGELPTASIFLYAYFQRNPTALKEKKYKDAVQNCIESALRASKNSFDDRINCKQCKTDLKNCRNKNGTESLVEIGLTLAEPDLPIIKPNTIDEINIMQNWCGIIFWVSSSKYYDKPQVIIFKNTAMALANNSQIDRIIIPLEDNTDTSVMLMPDNSRRYYGKLSFLNPSSEQKEIGLKGYFDGKGSFILIQ